MEIVAKQVIRDRVLEYLKSQHMPVPLRTITDEMRTACNASELRDSEVRNVVQSLIVTGKLDYAPGLKIELRKAATNTI